MSQPSRILIVCTGNTCRSPMAESMLRKLAEQKSLPIEVKSAGVSAVNGLPVSSHAAEALRKRDLPVPEGSSALTAETAEWADLILTMTSGHKRAVLERYPSAAGKIYTLKEYALSGEAAMADLAEAERIYADWQLKQALGESLSAEDRERLLELQRRLPSFDVADPFGGPLEVYESCAEEIAEALEIAASKMAESD
ncbi:low molecular weight protein arginine phosphatase [Cohnella lubricantis]|uniref:Low molecular weight protein arginine phosphatase n=1 Tax=Cohnella lubricantis TaxID=2163172 RepID=A0A841T9N6_9BACL|nr:low molecular weight protein arginine phosphatase [Cohnella lubricantis]MBB6676746.1 low molecular weight protein arginine phosphatase [Cohnella lubricantis]MBP2117792.1 protein-tyrosine phosphatase [Cohnella lubricantis]